MRIAQYIRTLAMRLAATAKRLAPLGCVVIPLVAVAIAATRLAEIPAARAVVATIREAGHLWWSMPLFVVLYVLFTVFLLPVGVLAATAALTWGWKIGGTLELITATISALVPYLLARRGLAGWIERRIPRERVPELDSPFVLFLLRLVPLVPFVALNYIAGATRVRPRDYVVTTFVGSIPSVFIFAYFVDTVASGAAGRATQMNIVIACLLVAAAAIIGRLVARRLAPRR